MKVIFYARNVKIPRLSSLGFVYRNVSESVRWLVNVSVSETILVKESLSQEGQSPSPKETANITT